MVSEKDLTAAQGRAAFLHFLFFLGLSTDLADGVNSFITQEAFEREVQIMRVAKHASCIELREAIATPNYLYLVMELMEGGELWERISSKSHYSETEAAECFVQLLQAVLHLHRSETGQKKSSLLSQRLISAFVCTGSNGIVHRDIKPENILYLKPEPDSRIKLIDFGLSRLVPDDDDNVALKTVCGSVISLHATVPNRCLHAIAILLSSPPCGFAHANTASCSRAFSQPA